MASSACYSPDALTHFYLSAHGSTRIVQKGKTVGLNYVYYTGTAVQLIEINFLLPTIMTTNYGGKQLLCYKMVKDVFMCVFYLLLS